MSRDSAINVYPCYMIYGTGAIQALPLCGCDFRKDQGSEGLLFD